MQNSKQHQQPISIVFHSDQVVPTTARPGHAVSSPTSGPNNIAVADAHDETKPFFEQKLTEPGREDGGGDFMLPTATTTNRSPVYSSTARKAPPSPPAMLHRVLLVSTFQPLGLDRCNRTPACYRITTLWNNKQKPGTVPFHLHIRPTIIDSPKPTQCECPPDKYSVTQLVCGQVCREMTPQSQLSSVTFLVTFSHTSVKWPMLRIDLHLTHCRVAVGTVMSLSVSAQVSAFIFLNRGLDQRKL